MKMAICLGCGKVRTLKTGNPHKSCPCGDNRIVWVGEHNNPEITKEKIRWEFAAVDIKLPW